LAVGDVQTLLRDLDLSPRRIDLAIAQERLDEVESQPGRVLRVERIEQVLSRRPIIIERR